MSNVNFSYSDYLNKINEGQIKILGTDKTERSLIEVGSQVYIYRNGTLEFHGMINGISYLDGGGISADVLGYESWLAKENGDYANSPWTNTASATIFNAILAECSQPTGSAWSAGTVEAGTDIDFRESKTDSLWNAINNLIGKTSQDIGIDYTNTEIDILDHKGSSSSVATFNSGIQISDIIVRQSYPIGNDVRVYGKGDGDNQIKSSTANGQDAGSKTTYGTIRKIERDSSIVSVAEANKLADSLVAMYKQPTKIYDFEVLNPSQSLVSGDVITLNAGSQNLSNEEVRITGINRGMKGDSEFLTLQVTNKEYSKLLKSRNEILASIEKNARDNQTYMSGTSNILTFSEMINANNTAPLRIRTPLPSSFIYDEAGNNRVNSFTIDYDVDPFRSGVGTASEDDVAPNVGGSSSSTQPGVSGTSGSSTPTATTGVSVWAALTVDYVHSSSMALTYARENLVGSPSYYTTRVQILLMNVTGGGVYVNPRTELPTSTVISHATNYFMNNNTVSSWESGETSSTNKTGSFKFWDDLYNCSSCTGTAQNIYSHTHGSHSHGDGNYGADNHLHADGSYIAGSHNHSVSIGDGISDSGSVNASQVSIYLDWYNTGTSNWDNKHSILNTGKTLDTDVDISDSGTYPDAAGFWRVRIITDNATPDLVQGVIKLKHQLDN